MLKITRVIAVMALLLVAVIGCDNTPTNSPAAPAYRSAFSSNLAASAVTIESATLHLFVTSEDDADVNVHRITSAWDEMTVTWNNFGGAYDAAIWGTTFVDNFGWESFDITSLVQAWAAGTYTNYGLLLDQDDTTYRHYYFSSDEAEDEAYGPFVVICYAGGACDTIYIDKDAYINENEPDLNTGAFDLLSTGNIYLDREKQSLLYFEVPVEDPLGALGDYVWYDTNMDGIQDAEEMGVEGVIVHLFDCEDVMLATDTTDAEGYYLFDSLAAGSYYVHFVLPGGYVFTLQDQGADDAMDSDADPTTGATICTILDLGETDLTWDAGIYIPEQVGCSHTIGYWKTHAGFGPQADVVSALLPIWLGDGTGESIQVTSAQMAVDILSQKVYGKPSNGITKLYAQLLGAKLSIADGASGDAIATAIAEADAFLADYSWEDWGMLTKEQQSMVMGWQYMFDQYNNGYIGPGHCEDEEMERE